MTQTINKLTGQALLDYVRANPMMTHTERCTGAGYLKDLDDGSKGCSFTEFFEAVLDARKANGDYQEPQQSGADWYDSLSDEGRELYDMIEDMCPEFTKMDAEQCQEFMDELSEIGITTAEQFQVAYYYQTDSWKAEHDFANYFVTEVQCFDIPVYLYSHIDWQSMWDHELSYVINTIEFDGETYFFSNDF